MIRVYKNLSLDLEDSFLKIGALFICSSIGFQLFLHAVRGHVSLDQRCILVQLSYENLVKFEKAFDRQTMKHSVTLAVI